MIDGVGARPADAVRLERLDQRGLGVARRRLGLVADRLRADSHVGVSPASRCGRMTSWSSSAASGSSRPLHVGAQEAGEVDPLAGGAEGGVADLERDRHRGLPRVGHLAGDGALPDQLVERAGRARRGPVPSACRKRRPPGGSPRAPPGRWRSCWRSAAARRGGSRCRTARVHRGPRRGDGLLRQVDRVGPHVGDEAALVQPLGRAHRVAGAEPQLAVGFLLQRRGGERRRRAAGCPASPRWR